MRVQLTTILLFICFLSFGQIPRVPKKVEFAGMTLLLNDAARREIQNDVDKLRASDKYFRIKLDRVVLYFPIVERVLKEEGVPDDFKYLCIQESALISDAVSSANAVGFWQFKDFTGREVGLRIDSKVDERKHIEAATRGAAIYMKRNNKPFDNWAYALSAYQAGPAGVRRYINKKYYGVKRMPITKKTHWYLKKYIAHKIAFQDELKAKHSEGLSLAEFNKGKGQTMEQIAKKFKVKPDLLRHYNKWLKVNKIPGDKKYVVYIPVKGKKPPKRMLAEEKQKQTFDPKPLSRTKTIPAPVVAKYPQSLKPGLVGGSVSVMIKVNGIQALLAGNMDNVSSLAAEAGLSQEKFMKYNDLREGLAIVPGETYYISPKKKKSALHFHIAQRNESLWSISQRYAIRMDQLAKKNRMSIIDEVKPGRVMWLQSKRPKNVPIEYHEIEFPTPGSTIASGGVAPVVPLITATKPPTRDIPTETDSISEESLPQPVEEFIPVEVIANGNKIHVVSSGETLWAISRAYNVTVDDILMWNELSRYDPLSIGQKLYVEPPPTKEEETIDTYPTKDYVVQAGDTFYRIAKNHNMSVTELMELNNRTSSDLEVGEILQVKSN